MAVKVWKRDDIPTVEETQQFLDMIQAIRNVFPSLPGLPEVPEDMDHFTYREANDIEKILSRIGWAVEKGIPQSRVYCGEFMAGGV